MTQSAATLRDGLAALDARYPGFRFRIVDEQGRIRPHIKMFIDAVQARDLAASLPAGAELFIVGALSGVGRRMVRQRPSVSGVPARIGE